MGEGVRRLAEMSFCRSLRIYVGWAVPATHACGVAFRTVVIACIFLITSLPWPAPAETAEAQPRIVRLSIVGDTLWLGTTSGLLRYATNESSVVRYDRRDGLPSATITDLTTDARGRLWVATPQGPAVLEESPVVAKDEARARGTEPWRGHGKLEEARTTLRFSPRTTGLPSRDITCLLATRKGALYAGTARGIAEWTGERWRAVYETHEFGRDRVLDAVEMPDGTLWFAKARSLTRFQGAETLVLWQDPINPEAAQPLRSTAARALAVDRNGALWLATGIGLEVLDGLEKIVEHQWAHGMWGKGALPSERVWSIHAERDGRVWVTYGDWPVSFVGVLDSPQSPWRTIPSEPPTSVYEIGRHEDGVLWAATAAGLYQLKGDQLVPASLPIVESMR